MIILKFTDIGDLNIAAHLLLKEQIINKINSKIILLFNQSSLPYS